MPALSIMATNDKHELAEFEPDGQNDRRLAEELNILKLEGSLFCYDPRAAKKRTGNVTIEDAKGKPVIIEPHPNYGQPSVLAYRILQAAFAKMTEEGYPYPSTVSFTNRELAKLVDRTWSGRTSNQMRDAALQLKTTLVHCSWYDKGLDEHTLVAFNVFDDVLFAVKGSVIRAGAIRLNANIVHSLNRRHVAFFNLQRLATLDVIGMAMYKRLFFHFSNIYNHKKMRRSDLVFTKDYEAVCREWLGGLKPLKYKSDIVKDQLGRHLEALRKTGLITGRVEDMIAKKEGKGAGLKLVCKPGQAFFADYEKFYLDRQQPQLRFKQTAAALDISQPLETVAYFHQQIGNQRDSFDEMETTYAKQLIERYGLQGTQDLIEYSVSRMRETGFKPTSIRSLSKYRQDWVSDQDRRHEFERRQAAIKDCPHCDDRGMLYVKNRTGAMAARVCPHDKAAIAQFEDAENLRVV